jgi:hypothetical protein
MTGPHDPGCEKKRKEKGKKRKKRKKRRTHVEDDAELDTQVGCARGAVGPRIEPHVPEAELVIEEGGGRHPVGLAASVA